MAPILYVEMTDSPEPRVFFLGPQVCQDHVGKKRTECVEKTVEKHFKSSPVLRVVDDTCNIF